MNEFLDIFLEEGEVLNANWEDALLALEGGYYEDQVNAIFRTVHTLKGSAKTVGLDDYSMFIHEIEDVIRDVLDGKLEINKILNQLLEWQHISEEWLRAVSQEKKYNFSMKEFNKQIKNIGSKKKANSVAQSKNKASEKKIETETSKDTTKKDSTLRLSATKVDQLLASAGQVLINSSALQRQIKEDPSQIEIISNLVASLQKHANSIHQDTLAIRMQPLSQFFKRIRRLVKDLSSQTGKPIQLETSGEIVEVDRSVAEKLMDPFVHIIRNAIDHGIEDSKGRAKKGKPNSGKIKLSARSNATGLEIIVEDDGKGLDPKMLRKKAIEKGLITPDTKLTDHEVQQLILKPGFSTKEAVSDLSGRGVGMDVVATTIRDLGGRLEIISTVGKGSQFILQIPVDLTILEAFVVNSGANRFCVLVQEVTKVIDLNEVGTKIAYNTEVTALKDEAVPIQNIAKIMGGSGALGNKSLSRPAFLTNFNSTPLVFEVDQIIRKQKIMVAESEDSQNIHGFSGVAILDDFHPGMILSLKQLAHKYTNQFRRSA